ncbi:MAG: cache domain-containing protein [Arcobacteraceae bacterium]
MFKNKEKKLLTIIKYSPLFFVSILAVIMNILIYWQNSIHFEKEINKTKIDFEDTQKLLVETKVNLAYNDIINQKNSIEENLKIDIKNRVYEAYIMIETLYKEHKSEGKDKVIEIIKNALRNVRFNDNRGYFFIDSVDGTKILQPINPEFEGKNFLEFKDPLGYAFVKTIKETIENKSERYDEYYWYKSDDKANIYKKISFYKTFEPLNFVIGAGEYIDDFTKEVQASILKKYIEDMSNNQNNYLFIVKYDGTYLSHVKKEYIGQNRINLIDKNGFKITEEIINTAKNKEGFIRYIGTIMPDTGLPALKTTYVKGFQEWEWALAAGFYDKQLKQTLLEKEDELRVKNKEYIKNIAIVSVLLTLILIAISLYISKTLQNYFFQYNTMILKEIKANKDKDKLLYQQSKMASMGEMISNIAHQWRQPLSMITSVASGVKLQKMVNISTQESELKALDDIMKSAQYLSSTIDDFRDFFKPNKEKSVVLLNDVFEKIFKLLSFKQKNNDINIIKNIEEIHFETFENELIQAVINIINNAKDALEHCTNKLLFIDAYEDKNQVIIEIKDSAGGISKENLQRVFEPYFTTKHKSQGTGVGLYMVKEILTRHMNGNIEVENSKYEYEGKTYVGAKFTIILKT